MFGLSHLFRSQKTAVIAAEETRSLADPESWLLDIFGATPTASGATVNPTTAMRCTPVRACVEAICEALGSLPADTYEISASGARNESSHPVAALVGGYANEWTSSSLFIEQLTRDALLWGNGFAFINRVTGKPRELIRLTPSAVTVKLDPVTGEPVYAMADTAGSARPIVRQNILHIPAPSIDGVCGQSPVTACKEAIGIAMTMEAHAARLFGRGARPSGLLKFPRKLGDSTAKKIAASWKAANAGENSGGTAVLEEGGDFQPLAFNSVDSQFEQLWARAVIAISQIYRVPPHLIFELGRATWGNAAEMGASFLRFTLSRWMKIWEDELRLKLFSPEERDRYCIEFNTDELLRADLAARADAYQKLISSRVLSPNEARTLEGYAPYTGGDTYENPNVTAGSPKHA